MRLRDRIDFFLVGLVLFSILTMVALVVAFAALVSRAP